ncbi:hypothetical protein [uncultured Maribacter sp.]|uniref:hypothetical protein n=1 Tax=uncultured Maribacter sp. TaxID=431308 RepID=UPI002636EB54|nr:hypothetical protein [uncultured Maribacter sp.]
MKKIMITLLLLVGMTTIAQRPEGKQGKGQRGAMQDFTPEQIATLHTKKLTLALDLTTAQQSKIKALALENATERKAKMEERKTKREEGDTKKPTSEERFTMQNARLDHKIAQKKKMKNILSEEQYSKWEKMQAHKNHKMRKHRKKHGAKKQAQNQKGK